MRNSASAPSQSLSLLFLCAVLFASFSTFIPLNRLCFFVTTIHGLTLLSWCTVVATPIPSSSLAPVDNSTTSFLPSVPASSEAGSPNLTLTTSPPSLEKRLTLAQAVAQIQDGINAVIAAISNGLLAALQGIQSYAPATSYGPPSTVATAGAATGEYYIGGH